MLKTSSREIVKNLVQKVIEASESDIDQLLGVNGYTDQGTSNPKLYMNSSNKESIRIWPSASPNPPWVQSMWVHYGYPSNGGTNIVAQGMDLHSLAIHLGGL